MPKQHVAIPMLEDVNTSVDALALRCPTMIGGIECHVLLPAPGPSWTSGGDRDLKAPEDQHEEGDPHCTDSKGWPDAAWGYITHDPGIDGTYIAAVSTIGLIPVSESVPWDNRLLDFDEAVGQWRHLLRDWLSVIAGGPTGFLDYLPVKGETRWADKGYTEEVWTYYFDNRQRPLCVSRWQWEHVLAHTHAGDQPPLARALLTTARRAAATGNPRLAVIDAATAAEVALTTGLTDRLSAETSSPVVVRALTDRTRMLGPRLGLARELGMALPDRINPDLVDRRNSVVHRGTTVTDTEAQAAITAAAELVDECEPLSAHCQEPGSAMTGEKSPPPALAAPPEVPF
jgi:hypothetical protein